MCVSPGQNVRPLNKHEYILDVATDAELVDPNYSFWFRRVVWTQTLKFENELCVAMHYNQVSSPYYSIYSTCALTLCCVCVTAVFVCVSLDSARLPQGPAKYSSTR